MVYEQPIKIHFAAYKHSRFSLYLLLIEMQTFFIRRKVYKMYTAKTFLT